MLTIISHRIAKLYHKRNALTQYSSNRILYFGYGANVDPDFFNKRVHGSQVIGIGKLNGFRFSFNLPCEYKGKGFGGLAQDENSYVYGTVYSIPTKFLPLLDTLEWVQFNFYHRRSLKIEIQNSYYTAEVYIPTNPREGLIPSDRYKEILTQGARKMNFPKEYVNWLEMHHSKSNFKLDHSFNLSNPGMKRSFPDSFYIFHDRIRERLCDFL